MIFQSEAKNPRDYRISGSYEKWILWLTWVKLKLALVWAKVKQSPYRFVYMQRCKRGSNKKRIIYLIWHSCKPIPCRPGLPRRKLLNRLESASRGLWCDEGPGLRQYRQQTPHSSGLVYWHKSSRELKNKSIHGYTAKLLSSIRPQQYVFGIYLLKAFPHKEVLEARVQFLQTFFCRLNQWRKSGRRCFQSNSSSTVGSCAGHQYPKRSAKKVTDKLLFLLK